MKSMLPLLILSLMLSAGVASAVEPMPGVDQAIYLTLMPGEEVTISAEFRPGSWATVASIYDHRQGERIHALGNAEVGKVWPGDVNRDNPTPYTKMNPSKTHALTLVIAVHHHPSSNQHASAKLSAFKVLDSGPGQMKVGFTDQLPVKPSDSFNNCTITVTRRAAGTCK